MCKLLVFVALFCLAGLPVRAAITPASLFNDNAVLQQKMSDPVWGTADPGEPITVTIAGQTATTTTDATGAWHVKLKPLAAGGPLTMTIAGAPGDTVTLSNILVGEVWICSGQSNMFFPLNGFPNDPLTRAAIPLSTDPLLHITIVPLNLSDTPQSTVALKWQEASPNTVGSLSAVGYFFARDLRRALGVPVGLIESAVGGTSAEAWTSHDALSENPALSRYLDEQADYVQNYPDLMQKYNAKIASEQPAYDTAMATWRTDSAAAKAAGTPLPTRPRSLPMPPPTPDKWFAASRLFNGMIAPLIPFAIRGTIWYQGEANWNQGYDYKNLFPALIADWRSRWGEGAFPFLYVELPGEDAVVTTPGNSWLAEVREAQRLTLTTTPNTEMVVINDLADQANIHPLRKEPVGDRLAIAARALVYGEKIESTGPVFSGFTVEGSKVRVNFTHADGLHAKAIHDVTDDGPLVAPGDKLVGFALAGADQVFYNADAVIDGESVVLSSPSVAAPVAVRYGWAQYPLTNLVNQAGLWASPFKTDDWRWISGPKVAK